MADSSRAYRTLHHWLILSGLMLFGLYLLWDHGMIAGLLESDRSYISVVILSGLLFATLHAGWRARALGRETCLAQQLLREYQQHSDNTDLRQQAAQLQVTDSFAHEHIRFLVIKAAQGDRSPAQELLLERLNQRIRGGHDQGWFIADLMLKLGLLGTVIGFIFMLGSVSQMNNIDVHALQQLLTNMSDGMRIALYTTLTGLTAGMLLGMQYQLLDRASDELFSVIVEIGEVHLPRHLDGLSGHALSTEASYAPR